MEHTMLEGVMQCALHTVFLVYLLHRSSLDWSGRPCWLLSGAEVGLLLEKHVHYLHWCCQYMHWCC